MQTRKIATERSAAVGPRRYSDPDVQQILKMQQASGLGVLAYCRHKGLNPASFYRWRNRVEGRRGRARAPHGGEARASEVASSGLAPPTAFPTLVPVVLRTGHDVSTGSVQIALGSGITAHVHLLNEDSARWMGTLVAQLRRGHG